MTQQTITPDMTIEDILSLFPHKSQKLANEITRAGLHCVGCGAATWETLEAGMLGHGMAPESITTLVSRLNSLLQEQSDPNTITLSEKAAQKFREFAEEEGKQGWGLRFAEQAAGCSGLEYDLDFSQQADEHDAVFHSQGLEIHVKKALIGRLIGCDIDYVDGLYGAGFKISNPNVKSGCGCGQSHSY